MTIKIGFTGTQSVSQVSQERLQRLYKVLEVLAVGETTIEFHHGGCVGMDEIAHRMASNLGYQTVVHWATEVAPNKVANITAHEEREGKPPLERNHDIVDECDTLIAVPKNPETEERRSGTWATIRYARQCDAAILYV